VSARSRLTLRVRPVALVAIGYMFVTNLDSIFVIPLLPVLHGGSAAAIARDVAFALSLRLGASLLMSLLLPVLAPRARNSAVLLAASLLKAAGFACLMIFSSPIGIWFFAVLAGAGTGTLRPAVRAVIADETRGRGQALAFQGLFLAMNVAFVIGPLLAEAAIRMGQVPSGLLAVAAVEIGAGLLVFRLVPARGATKRVENVSSPFRLAMRALSGGQWLLMAQTLLSYVAVGFLIASLVLFEAINPPLAAWRNALLSAEGLAVIGVQIALMPLFSRLPRPLVHAVVALAAGCGLALSFSAALPLTLLGLVVFAVGECLAMPVAQIELSERSAARDRRGVFALAMVAAAFGEIAGAWLAWGVARAEAVGLSGIGAGQGVGIVLGCALGAIAWALAVTGRSHEQHARSPGRFAEEGR
jgi:MFS family permease